MLKKLLTFLVMMYAALSFAAVDVNKATAADLDSVKGIGPAIAGKIIDERKNGNFKDWNDLITRVKGIGETSAAKLSEGGLTVGGASFKGAAPAAAPAAKKEDKPAAAAPAAATAKKEEKPAAKAEAAPAAKEEKKDAKAEAKAKKEADKKAKEDAKAEKKAAKEAHSEKKDDKKAAEPKAAASAAKK